MALESCWSANCSSHPPLWPIVTAGFRGSVRVESNEEWRACVAATLVTFWRTPALVSMLFLACDQLCPWSSFTINPAQRESNCLCVCVCARAEVISHICQRHDIIPFGGRDRERERERTNSNGKQRKQQDANTCIIMQVASPLCCAFLFGSRHPRPAPSPSPTFPRRVSAAHAMANAASADGVTSFEVEPAAPAPRRTRQCRAQNMQNRGERENEGKIHFL